MKQPPKVKVVIPFRDRGKDLRRGANLEVVIAWWYSHGFSPVIVGDGLEGDTQFNRHKAYNKAVAAFPETEVFIFTEADMLIPIDQVAVGVRLAQRKPGLVVPFMQYRYLSDEVTANIRDSYNDLTSEELAQWFAKPSINPASIFSIVPESTMENGKSIGAVNIVSRETLELTGGFTEATRGNWYDDNIIKEGFEFITGNKTAWVPGPAVHLYHLPGWKGDHLSDEDKAATQHNKDLLESMRTHVRRGRKDIVTALMQHREGNLQ